MELQYHIINRITARLHDADFQARHKLNATFFTRRRSLPFATVMVMLMQKSVKSLQIMVNEFFEKLALSGVMTVLTVTNSAFSQARQKLQHTAFIELHRTAIVLPYYEHGGFQTWQGFRLGCSILAFPG